MEDDDDLIMLVAVAGLEVKYRSVSRKRSGLYKTLNSPFQLEMICAEAIGVFNLNLANFSRIISKLALKSTLW
jgi:hypothetical protein